MTTTEPTDRVAAYRAARARVLDRIGDAASRTGRDPASVALLAISKTVHAGALRDALAAGLVLLGENRVQEAIAKAPDVPGARWQLVGPLQGNKARKAMELFESIQSVDSIALAERLNRLRDELRPAVRYPVLLQVNVDGDPAKAGFLPADLEDVALRVGELTGLEVSGLMTIGRLVDDPEAARPTFQRLRSLSEAVRGAGAPIGGELSMGMTDDFEVAIEEGATIVRVGRALFGERHDHRHEPGHR